MLRVLQICAVMSQQPVTPDAPASWLRWEVIITVTQAAGILQSHSLDSDPGGLHGNVGTIIAYFTMNQRNNYKPVFSHL